MGYSKIARLSTDSETTFGTDQAESYLDQRLVRETVDLDLLDARLPDPTTTQRLHEENKHVVGSKFGSTIAFQCLLEGLANADALNAGATYTYPQANISELLRRGFGGSSGNAGSLVVNAGSTTSIVNVTAGQGTRFAVGTAVGFVIGGVVEVRRVIANAANSVTVHMALSAVPADGAVVYNSETFFLDEDGVGGDGNSLILRLLGFGAASPITDQWLCRGVGIDKITFEMAMNDLLKVAFACKVATWTKTTGETLGTATYDGGGGLPVRLSEVQYANAQTTVTTVARNLLSGVEAFSIDPGLSIEPEPSISGIETVARWRQMSAVLKARLTVRGQAAFDTFHTDASAAPPQDKSLGIQIGNTTGTGGTGIVYLHCPRLQFARTPKRVEAGGFVKTEVEFDGREDAATGLSTDVGVSKIYVSLL